MTTSISYKKKNQRYKPTMSGCNSQCHNLGAHNKKRMVRKVVIGLLFLNDL